jgi:hypothetical protein
VQGVALRVQRIDASEQLGVFGVAVIHGSRHVTLPPAIALFDGDRAHLRQDFVRADACFRQPLVRGEAPAVGLELGLGAGEDAIVGAIDLRLHERQSLRAPVGPAERRPDRIDPAAQARPRLPRTLLVSRGPPLPVHRSGSGSS